VIVSEWGWWRSESACDFGERILPNPLRLVIIVLVCTTISLISNDKLRNMPRNGGCENVALWSAILALT